ncbi:hypothetical protein [Inediibacterium massiliense]|uniref:hypothetical protein n=1 Tax=Inediibacterium massiliense TaxID=1658111 RepID=UPI0006B51244|nr:hypothetical protein [Inediibacterium massiliense]
MKKKALVFSLTLSLMFSGTIIGNAAPYSSPSISALQYELDQKNIEITNLKFQLSQKNVELDILRNNHTSSNNDTYSSSSIKDVQDILNDRYDDHKNNGRTMYFDDFTVNQLSNGKIQVKVYADFDRDDRIWKSRSDSNFEDFIKDICKEINKKYEKDIEITVYDKDRDRIAEYNYDEYRNKLKSDYTYGGSSSSSNDLDDVEKILNDDYNRHKNDGRTLKFDYTLVKYSNEIDVKMYGDFYKNDREWKSRDKKEFEKFVKDVCKEVNDEFDTDVMVYVYDKNKGNSIGRYKFADKDDYFEVKYEE